MSEIIIIFVVIIVVVMFINMSITKPTPPATVLKCSIPNCNGTMRKITARSKLGYQYEIEKCVKCGAVRSHSHKFVGRYE